MSYEKYEAFAHARMRGFCGRSIPYRQGAVANLRNLNEGAEIVCIYSLGSTEYDAFCAGCSDVKDLIWEMLPGARVSDLTLGVLDRWAFVKVGGES
ncbi:MAG: hypothetical protein AB7S90_15810 [Marinobacterium sp.]